MNHAHDVMYFRKIVPYLLKDQCRMCSSGMLTKSFALLKKSINSCFTFLVTSRYMKYIFSVRGYFKNTLLFNRQYMYMLHNSKVNKRKYHEK